MTLDDVKIFVDTFAPGVWVRLDGDDEMSLARRMGTTWVVLDRVLPAAKPSKFYLATRLGNHVTSTLFQAMSSFRAAVTTATRLQLLLLLLLLLLLQLQLRLQLESACPGFGVRT